MKPSFRTKNIREDKTITRSNILKVIDFQNQNCHHEKWNGSGYPRGLKGDQIPLAARIFSVVDVWDALTSDRPYRQAWSHEKALEYIKSESGKQFDPTLLKICLEAGVFDRTS